MGEVVQLPGGAVSLQAAVDAFLDHHDLALLEVVQQLAGRVAAGWSLIPQIGSIAATSAAVDTPAPAPAPSRPVVARPRGHVRAIITSDLGCAAGATSGR